MTFTLVEPFAGAAAVTLRQIGGRRLKPLVSWMGGKRRLAQDILDAMGVPARERPAKVVLNDAGPWGWVWPVVIEECDPDWLLLALRGWAYEFNGEPRKLWSELASVPLIGKGGPIGAAQWLWLQARSASGVAVWWDGDKWCMGERPEFGGVRSISQKGNGAGSDAGIVNPATIAERIEAVRAAFAETVVEVRHGDAAELPVVVDRPTFVYVDPPYRGATGYGWDCERPALIELAQRWSDARAVVAISEAEPLEIPGWHTVELTLEGGKPEWLTLSRPPTKWPERQQGLFEQTAEGA